MPIYLTEIVDKKREDLKVKNLNIAVLKEVIKTVPERPSFKDALTKDGLSIIGEIKKASPSKGLIKADFEPVELAELYENSVDAISVLTEERYFLGSDDYLKAVSASVSLPTLCKDFIVSEEQIYNAKALGASCILLIVNILTDGELKGYLELAESLGLDVLVETHDEEEVARALAVDARIIGINNRNLKTFETTLDVTLRLADLIPEDKVVVSESGILSPEDIKTIRVKRIDAVLVGENFMRSDDIIATAKALKEAYQKG